MSTLHTNDAPSAITRLIDIGIEPYLLMPSLILIVAQRLIRKLCQHCKEGYEPSDEEKKTLNLGQDLIYRAKGCDKCNHVGYSGRTCVSEVLVVTEEKRRLIVERAESQKIMDVARKNGMLTLGESALVKVREGITSLEEALSATMV